MEEGKKKQILIGVVVICLVVAAVMAFSGGEPDGTSTSRFKGKQVWIKCANEECAAEYQMDKEQYFIALRENMDPQVIGIPGLPCKECDEPSIYRAIKCAKCEMVFFKGESGPGKIDECPDCGYSESRELKEKAKARQKNR